MPPLSLAPSSAVAPLRAHVRAKPVSARAPRAAVEPAGKIEGAVAKQRVLSGLAGALAAVTLSVTPAVYADEVETKQTYEESVEILSKEVLTKDVCEAAPDKQYCEENFDLAAKTRVGNGTSGYFYMPLMPEMVLPETQFLGAVGGAAGIVGIGLGFVSGKNAGSDSGDETSTSGEEGEDGIKSSKEVVKLQSEVKAKDDELERLNSEFKFLKEETAKIIAAEKDKVTQQAAQNTKGSEAEMEKLRRQVTDLKAALEPSERENATLAAALEALKEKGDSNLAAELEVARLELSSTTQELDEEKQRCEQLKDRIAELEASGDGSAEKAALIASHEKEMAKMTTVIDQLKARTDQLTTAVENLKSSEIRQFTTITISKLQEAFPEADLENIFQKDLPKVLAHKNFRNRNTSWSTEEEQLLDWMTAKEQISNMQELGYTDSDFLAEFCRVSAELIMEGDWVPFTGTGDGTSDEDVRRGMLGIVLNYFANTLSVKNYAQDSSTRIEKSFDDGKEVWDVKNNKPEFDQFSSFDNDE